MPKAVPLSWYKKMCRRCRYFEGVLDPEKWGRPKLEGGIEGIHVECRPYVCPKMHPGAWGAESPEEKR